MTALPRRIMAAQRTVYLVALSAGLATGMWLGIRADAEPAYRFVAPHVPVLSFIILAAMGLLALGASTIPYATGLCCMLIALLGFWAASPKGSAWASYALHNLGYTLVSTQAFGYILLLLFPMGWILLADSIGSWKRGILTYFGAGLTFVGLHVLLLGSDRMAQFPLYWLFWPHFTLTGLGMFGWGSG